jgi:type VI secretion system protein ImpA
MTRGWDDLARLVQPITPEAPCGENLENSPLLSSLDSLRVFGQDAPPDKRATPPNWSEIREKAIEGLEKSKDLQLLAYLGTALLRTDGLPAFVDTLKIASEWLTTYWPQTYPLVDDDGVLRRNVLNCFADQMAIIDSLRRVPLVNNRQYGRFALRDIEIAAGQIRGTEGEARPDQGHINAAFAAMPLDELTALQQSVAEGLVAVKKVDAKMSEAGAGKPAGFESLSAQFAKVDRVLRAQLAARPDGRSGVTADGEAGATVVNSGVVTSRQEAIRALEAVADFFRQTEPSSPIPMLLERAKRLVNKSFLEVLADIAPDALGQAKSAGGQAQSETVST